MSKRIDDWAVVFTPNATPHIAPEMLSQHLNGQSDRDGVKKYVTTSPIKGRRNGCVVTTTGSEYELGTVRPEYESRFPNATERLMGSLPELGGGA